MEVTVNCRVYAAVCAALFFGQPATHRQTSSRSSLLVLMFSPSLFVRLTVPIYRWHNSPMRSAAILLLLLCGTVNAQEKKTLIFVTDTSNVSKAEIGKSLSSDCPEVSVTIDQQKSAYSLEAVWTGAGPARKPYKFSLFNNGGEYVFSTQTARLNNAVKDVCIFVRKEKR